MKREPQQLCAPPYAPTQGLANVVERAQRPSRGAAQCRQREEKSALSTINSHVTNGPGDRCSAIFFIVGHVFVHYDPCPPRTSLPSPQPPAMPPHERSARAEDPTDLDKARVAGPKLAKPGGLTTKAFSERFWMSHARARYFVLNGRVVRCRVPSTFFNPEEKVLLAKYLAVNATVGRGLTQDSVSRVCALYLSELSLDRQAEARARFNGSLTPGRGWVTCVLDRHPELVKYRVGTLEESQARNSRPEVVRRWYALLSLMYRDDKRFSSRQVWNMDETHTRARISVIASRIGIVRGVRMTKPEFTLPPSASGSGACTMALCGAAAGVVAPHLVVVDGQAPGHGIVIATGPDCFKRDAALTAWLNDESIVWRRSPPGMDKAVFDVWCEMFANVARSYYPEEAKVSSLNDTKVRLSPKGLIVLLRSNVHVIVKPLQKYYILQALDNSSTLGLYQPKVRSRVRKIAFECRDAGRLFNTPELMCSTSGAASNALTESALRSALRRVGIWPLDSGAVSREELSKEADTPIASVDFELLTRRLLPSNRKDIKWPRAVNATLSTAGRGTVLTASVVLAALEGETAAKMATKAIKEAGNVPERRRLR